jgi:hypothetical protein
LLHRDDQDPIVGLLGLYIAVSFVASVFIRLKEPRYVIGLIPAACMVVGLSFDWDKLARRVWSERRGWVAPAKRAILTRLGMVFVFLLIVVAFSPLRLLPRSGSGLERWIDPGFYYRIVHNDRYYGALAEAGAYLRVHSRPGSVIAVIHEAPAVGYYADRSYRMLYTLSHERILEVLEQTEYLVFDRVVFLSLQETEVQQVLDYIMSNFESEHEIWDSYRRVDIMHRIPKEQAHAE